MYFFKPIQIKSIVKIKWLNAFLFFLMTSVSAQEVIPDFYKEPGINPNRNYVNQNFNEHIDPFTGSLQLHYVDLHIPGNGGFDLNVVRSYNSASIDTDNPSLSESTAGIGWNIHFGRILKTKDTNVCLNSASVAKNPVLELPDGSRQLLVFRYANTVSNEMTTTQRWRVVCNGSGVVAYSPEGTRYDMNQLVNIGTEATTVMAWYTSKITDKNGNYAIINYARTNSPEISSISTNDSRQITFNYADSGNINRRISSISGPSQTVQYNYISISSVQKGKYFLSTVKRPDGSEWNYDYNDSINSFSDPKAGSYLIKKVTYPTGGYINYTYEFFYYDAVSNPYRRSNVVKSKSNSTGGNWRFTYTVGSSTKYDTTIVETPIGKITYEHIGPNYVQSGSVWMIGLLVSKSLDSVQKETYSWGKQKISSETYFRPGNFVTKVDAGETNAPILLQKRTVRDGATYTITYGGHDTYGNPGSITESGTSSGSRTTTLTYHIDTTNWIVNQIKNENGTDGTVIREFDSNGNLAAISTDGVKTTYVYDSQGNISSITFPRGLIHTYSNYKRGIPQNESQSEGISISRIISDAGNLISETNGESYTTKYDYDSLNRVRSIDYPSGSSVSLTYGTTSKIVTRGPLVERTDYNSFGYPVKISLNGITRNYSVDAVGRRTFESNPDNSSSGTSYSYDVLNRTKKITHSDGKSIAINYSSGNKTVTDERSNSTTYSYRTYGNPDQQFLMAITTPNSIANISISRTSSKRSLISSITQGGITRSYSYDNNNYLISVINPETGSTTYGRDDAGNMTSREVGSSGRTSYQYDSQNRLKSVIYPGNTPSITNTYNNVHKLISANTSTGNRTFSYDGNGNLTRDSLSIDGYTFSTTYTYNSLDQLSSITYPYSQSTVSYSPDNLGRPTQVSNYISSVSYWASGQIKQINYANGTNSVYGQNSRLWPSSFTTKDALNNYHVNSNYNYDGVGNIESISDSTDSQYNRTLNYDGINRLTSANGPWGSGSINYDSIGNIKYQAFGTNQLSYIYDASNRLQSISGGRSARDPLNKSTQHHPQTLNGHETNHLRLDRI